MAKVAAKNILITGGNSGIGLAQPIRRVRGDCRGSIEGVVMKKSTFAALFVAVAAGRTSASETSTITQAVYSTSAPQYQESTDDAYVGGNIVQVASEIAGTVVFTSCDRNQFVRVGQLVVELDDADARIAVEREKANLSNHPDVRAAADQLHAAYRHLARTRLPASVSGFVATCTVELGQRVSPGQPLMAIVPLNELWVEANFQERQLATIRVGQPAPLKARLYGGDVTYHGTVASLGGIVSSFVLPPSQNATGGGIKVAQPEPVGIALDSRELVDHPLQLGLPITVEVDTREQNDAWPSDLATEAPTYFGAYRR